MARGNLPCPQKVRVLGVPVTPNGLGEIEELLELHQAGETPLTVSFVNPLAVKLVRDHSQYLDDLDQLGYVACDGIGMVKAALRAGLEDYPRQAFDNTSLAPRVLAWAQRNAVGIGLVGGEDQVSAKAAELMRLAYPGLIIEKTFSGFGDQPKLAAQYFLEHQTQLVVCGMGAPQQERFLLQLAASGWSGAGFTCGGFMDQLLSGEDYYPKWIDQMDIRFLYRLLREPRRLWRRYLVDYQVFMAQYLRQRFGGKTNADRSGQSD